MTIWKSEADFFHLFGHDQCVENWTSHYKHSLGVLRLVDCPHDHTIEKDAPH